MVGSGNGLQRCDGFMVCLDAYFGNFCKIYQRSGGDLE